VSPSVGRSSGHLELDTRSKTIANVGCITEIDGERAGELDIEGEVYTGKPNRRPMDYFSYQPHA